MEKAKLQEAKTYMNNYRADGNELDNFTQHRRNSLQLEKAKSQEARSYLNKYRADGNELNTFTESRRLEKAKLQEAKAYMNNYRADGNELLTFTERRRKNLLCERVKLQEAKSYMNNYRAESNGLLQTSSYRRRYSTGSKSSRVPLNDKANDITVMTPKRLFIPNNDHKNDCEEWIAGDQSLEQCDDRNPSETSNKRAPLSARKETKGFGKNKNGDSRRVHSDISNSLLTKIFDSNEHPLSELIAQRDIPVFPYYKHETDLGVTSRGREYLPGGDNNDKHNSCIPCNDNDMKSAYDPYNDDNEDNATYSSNRERTDGLAHICERVKVKDCFTCSVM
jgi:hypothetical protein